MMNNKEFKKYFNERFKKLITFDKIRIYKLLEIIQFIIIYTLLAIPISGLIEDIFPYSDNTKSTLRILIEILLQTITLGIIIFYIQKIAKLLPFIFHNDKTYKIHTTSEYEGYTVLSVIFLGTQKNLLNKISILHKRMNDYVGLH